MKTAADLTLLEIMRRYSTEEAARSYFERVRWPNGPTCPHCGSTERIYARTANAETGVRPGLYKCGECEDTFTVTVGTVMEDSKVPLSKWLIAFYMMCASKTQVSALQLQRQLELGSYRTALFLCHRIRFALKEVFPSDKLDGAVEVDEPIGGKEKNEHASERKHLGRDVAGKIAVVSLVERGGHVRSHVVGTVTDETVGQVLKQHVAETANLNMDESPVYKKAGNAYSTYDVVNHNKEECARYDRSGGLAATNTAEGFFGSSKRSIDGTHHQVSRQQLHLSTAELDFKYNTRQVTDGERTAQGVRRMEGKRLMYLAKGAK